MKTKLFIISGVSVLFLTVSCKVMHVPTLQSVPMFKEKGEMHATVSLRNFQFAYSVSDKSAILLNGFYIKDKPFTFGTTDEAFNFKRNIYQVDAGIGRYKNVDNLISTEIFSGLGWGHSQLSYNNLEAIPKQLAGGASYFLKWYLQPNLYWKKIAFSGRIEYINFYNFKEPNYSTSFSISSVLLNPAISLKLGGKRLYSLFQIQYSIPLTSVGHGNGEYACFSNLFLCSIAVELRINELFRTKNKSL